MEVKINREIRDYTESMFFGLSLRQFIFSVLACAVAVGVYFLLRPVLGLETTSWVCIIAAVPFAAIGFLKYNGMPAEKIILAIIRSEFILLKHLCFGNSNVYMQLLEGTTCGTPIAHSALGSQKHKEFPAKQSFGATPLRKGKKHDKNTD